MKSRFARPIWDQRYGRSGGILRVVSGDSLTDVLGTLATAKTADLGVREDKHKRSIALVVKSAQGDSVNVRASHLNDR
jgi:hypothetical protein